MHVFHHQRVSMARLLELLVVLTLLQQTAALFAKASPTIVRMERAARELAATFIFEGLVQVREPLEIFDDPRHQSFWFESSKAALEADLRGAADMGEKTYETVRPVAPPSEEELMSASPLLVARSRRAQPTKRIVTAAPLQAKLKLPAGAEPLGPPESAPDTRSGASRALVRQKLSALHSQRAQLEAAVSEMLDPLVAPSLPAFDLAVLLLFLSELASGLPVPVASKEAAMLSAAYSGDANGKEQQSVRHVQGVLGAYARERLGREV